MNMDDLKLSCHELSLPVTEKCNPISRDIDRVNGKQMVQILRRCDAEIFEKKDHDPFHQRLYSSAVIQTMVDVAKRVEMMLRDPEESVIVLSGCGTSGRIAFLLVTSFNEMMKAQKQKQICSYIIAGGDRAMLTSQEAPEDDPALGAHTLEKICAGKKHVLFIGISCGMSAPFVAGQLDFCLQHLDIFTPVLLGFNPVHMARSEPMQGCSFHFKDVAERMTAEQRHEKAFVLNPVLGAEAISGSSRMKGGSATKIILESILLAGHEAAFRGKRTTPECISGWITASEMVYETTYSHSDELAALIHQAGESLRMKAHVYYIGWGTLGIIGLTDASECVPTYGADFDDIRGFINNGFREMKNKEGDLSCLGPEFVIGHKDFVDTILPSLSQNDMVLFLFAVNDDLHEVTALADQVRRRTSNLHAIAHDLEKFTIPETVCNMFGTILRITWPFSSEEVNSVVMRQRWELSTKWCLNAISTGAHVLKGKVYMNYMIDLRVSNSKLYTRAINILQRFTGCSKSECVRALLRAIYSTEDLSEDMTSADVWKHTDAANRRDRVVPTALVMIQCGCTLTEARHHLDCHPVIRDAVNACFNSSKTKSTVD
ncbi:glucokinase regulatory protein isoform X1 [Carassius auratus]|uniref:Glucokinase regulatory protein isoform X1 n=2 Tax=Carassius auratus TaxID=7957 RepID=A0A6P6LMP8_CARAU|nr:glucokinase regulatory protein isoform X1 [Carassius auratus]XP_026085824.1 glucokinase regulatory protein isoform X1 [Carassius auratus]